VRTFIVRLHPDSGRRDRGVTEGPGLHGVVDEVGSGLRATFTSGQELLAALVTAVAAEIPGPPWGGEHRAAHPLRAGQPEPDHGEE
jgi:hypothetical protein